MNRYFRFLIILLILNNVISTAYAFELTERDQYIIIATAAILTMGIITVFFVTCYIKCYNQSNKYDKASVNSNYKSLDKIYPDDYSSSSSSADRKMATSAQMYHYQLSKQQLIDKEKAEMEKQKESNLPQDDSDSNDDSTVFECHGLAKVQNMAVYNPIFDQNQVKSDSQTDNGHITSNTNVINIDNTTTTQTPTNQ